MRRHTPDRIIAVSVLVAALLAIAFAALRADERATPGPGEFVSFDEAMQQLRQPPSRRRGIAPCLGVDFLPARFAGKPSPFAPGEDVDQLHAYIRRYDQAPGQPSALVQPGLPSRIRERYEQRHGPEDWAALAGRLIPGYTGESEWANGTALQNAAANGGSGPGGEALRPGCPTFLEQTDASFTARRGDGWYRQWVVAFSPGGKADNPVHVNNPAGACGPYTVARHFFSFYAGFFINDPPCGSPAPTPTPAPTATPTPLPTPTATPAPECEECPPPVECEDCPVFVPREASAEVRALVERWRKTQGRIRIGGRTAEGKRNRGELDKLIGAATEPGLYVPGERSSGLAPTATLEDVVTCTPDVGGEVCVSSDEGLHGEWFVPYRTPAVAPMRCAP
jgi:hypothetical protein